MQFIDASALFKKETNNNVLTDAHIEQIMQVFESKADTDYLAKSVAAEDVAKNDYNLSVSSYVESEDTREVIDITVLNAELKTTVSKLTSYARISMRLWQRLRVTRRNHEWVELSEQIAGWS